MVQGPTLHSQCTEPRFNARSGPRPHMPQKKGPHAPPPHTEQLAQGSCATAETVQPNKYFNRKIKEAGQTQEQTPAPTPPTPSPGPGTAFAE